MQLHNIAAINFFMHSKIVTFPLKSASLAIIPARPTIITNHPPSINECRISTNSDDE